MPTLTLELMLQAGASYNAVVLGTELLLSASADSLSPVSSAEDIASQLLSHKLLWPDCTTEIVAELHRDLEVATKHCSQGIQSAAASSIICS